MAEIVSIFFLFMFSVPCQVVADVGRRMAAGVEPVLDCLHCSLQSHTVTLSHYVEQSCIWPTGNGQRSQLIRPQSSGCV